MLNKKRKYKIKYQKERVLLSDILPYEVPLFFSNKNFYNYILKYNNSDPSFKKKVPEFLKKHLLGIGLNDYTIPFNFEIRHKEDKPRILSIIHPKNQILVSNFYDKYKDLIIYYGNISNFSLRKINSISKEEYYDDDLHKKLFSEKSPVEVSSKEYKSCSSFFTYEDYSIMYKFFESFDYHKEEKKFSKMVKTDISRCFDQVYTHSFTWAVFGKKFVKDNLSLFINNNGNNFVNEFDVLMQKMNYNETNGIVIGPEFSRIFSEIILQRIDNNIQNSLLELKLENKVHYSIHRYIDDYFIFYNNDIDLEKIKKILINKLQEYHFSINDSKTRYFTKPLITEETIAKNEIKKLFFDQIILECNGDEFIFKLNSTNIKTEIKSITYRNNLKYENLLNYTFHLFSKKIIHLGKIYKDKYKDISDEKKKHFERDIFKFIWESLDVIFFLYSAEPKVAHTISISGIISDIINITKNNINNESLNEYIYKKIYDEIYISIQINSNKKWSRLENIYLITILRELGPEYSLSDDFLMKNLINNNDSPRNYFEIISILFYIQNKVENKKIFDYMIDIIKKKIESVDCNIHKDTELFLLLMDVISNPSIDIVIKKDILKSFDKNLKPAEISNIVKYILNEDIRFTDWGNFNFRDSVKLKKRLRVY